MIMKKKYFTAYLFFLFSFAIHSQVVNSVLSEGIWFKFSVDTTGVFKIDKSLLQEIGIATNNLNPKKIHIYGNGGDLLPESNGVFRYDGLQENAIFVEGEEDNSFDTNDYILFYAKGPHSWSVNTTSQEVTHKQNIYSDKAYYFITVNDDDGKRIQNAVPISGNPVTEITTFNDYTFYENETSNLFATGRRWLGEEFSLENQQTFQIPFSNVVQNEPLKITVRAVGVSGLTSTMKVNVNSQELFSLNFSAISSGSDNLASDRIGSENFSNTSSTVSVLLDYDNGGNPSARAYLDFIEISGKKQLISDGFQFSFRNFSAANTSGIVEYQIQNSQNIYQIWEVSDHINVTSIANESSSGNFSFKAMGGDLKEYVVVSENDYYTPESVANASIENQNLHALKDINYLLITTSEFLEQAQRIANFHIENSELTAKVVLLDEIYNEFSSGSKDITGIRDFIRHIYSTNSSESTKLKFVCFFGDASYDYKDRIAENNNIVPVYLADESFNLAYSYVTDDFFAMLEENEGSMSPSHSLDLATGRIPVSTQKQASEVVDKILRDYNLDSYGDWRNTITLVADDIDEDSDREIQSGVEIIADDIKDNKPVFNVNKIYADSYVQQNSSGGEQYPRVKAAITSAIESGTLVFDYFGHGGENGFAQERFLDVPQIKGFQNENTLPLFISVTCSFSRFDNPSRISAGEFTLWNTTGGAASMITTTREVFIRVGQAFNKRLIASLLQFDNEELSISESLVKTKNNY